MAAPVVQWVCRELSRLLEVDATEDIAKYILAIESKQDLEEYLLDLLDGSVPRNKKFIQELLTKWRPPERQIQVPENVQVYNKKKMEVSPTAEKTTSKKKNKKASQNSAGAEGKAQNYPPASSNGLSMQGLADSIHKPTAAEKKKSKFVPLFSEDGQNKTASIIPGRHPCDCLASKHDLINNCTQCGRIVCKQEQSGPCLYCGALVCTNEEKEILSRGSRKSEKLRDSLMRQESSRKNGSQGLPGQQARRQEGLDKALQHKNKLLDYDRTSAKRTQVIDDESDYFSTDSNQWLSDREREKLRKREAELRELRHGSRLNQKVTLDFAGRRVTEEDTRKLDIYDVNDDVVQEIHYGKSKSGSEGFQMKPEDFQNDLVNPNIDRKAPKFIPTKDSAKKAPPAWGPPKEGRVSRTMRIQDSGLQEMADEGMCMSMHQPWASLLVEGIKIHEGRTWYTPHRGRLWIAATAKAATPQEIHAVESQYREMDPSLQFPKQYPTGCLLGSVEVKDCLAEDDYRKMYPNGESSCPFVFICDNPQDLVVKFPIKGKHKIYKLESHIHQAAKKGLRSALGL